MEFSEYIVHKDKTGNIVSINGNFAKIPESFQVEPILTFDEAINIATIREKSKYHVFDLSEERSVEKPITKRDAKHEVVIVKGYDNQWHLAFKANLVVNNIFDNFFGYIDCGSGETVFKQPLVSHSNATGSAATLYSGSREIISDSYAGGYRLRENRGGGTPIQTYNFHRAPSYSIADIDSGLVHATDFTDNDNNWTMVEHYTDKDQAALDAHWGAEMTYDYFSTVHGRNSYDGNGSLIKGFVHVRTRDETESHNIIEMNNAFWSDNFKAMFYGDGNSYHNPWVSLDICSHELGHAVCYASIGNGTGLINNGESGALNEGLSDIWGACVEQWATTNKQTWLLGEDINWGTGFRSMANPHDHQQPNTYRDTLFWFNTTGCVPNNPDNNDNCGVHTNSGVLNHWFYLLSVGDSGVSGIGITSASSIVYWAETGYLGSTDQFNDMRTKTIQVAIDHYGMCSAEVKSVTDAWHAVGVGAAWVNPIYNVYKTYSLDCNAVTLDVRDKTTSEPITWTTTNGLLLNGNSSPYTQYGNTMDVTSPNGTGGLISGTIGSSCSTADFDYCPCQSWNASITWIWSSPVRGEPLVAEVSPLKTDGLKYKWFINGELVESTDDGYLSTTNWPCSIDEVMLSVIAITECGATVPVSSGFYPSCTGNRMTSNVSLFPNPASSEVTIKLEETQNIDKQQTKTSNSMVYLSEITQINIVDKMGLTRKVIKFGKGNKNSTLNISELPSDVYYLDISDGNQHVRKALIISK
ncbi:MAG: M4 family metallopeptidase [Prolixibacteraceae bacterium]|nr:M4 family metallopeptidase [Prolixibacteraceae bacterium]